MKVEDAIAKASVIMWRYRVSKEDQVEIVKMLVDAGVEKCLDEQERIARENEELLKKAYVGPGLPRRIQ